MKLTIPQNIRPLSGHTSAETAFVVTDYPYGGLTCTMRFWVETKDKKGQRLAMQSINPKTQRVNAPKLSTYSELICLFVNNENGHCENARVGINDDKVDFDLFESTFESVMTEWQKKHLAAMRAFLISRSPVSYYDFNNAQREAWEEQHKALREEFRPDIEAAQAKGEKLTGERAQQFRTKRAAIIENILAMPK